MSKYRSTYLDNISGLLIVYMILGHLFQLYEVTNTFYYHIHVRVFFFFMSWFFYKAGMFDRSQSIKQTITRSARRLLVPFLIFSFLGSFVLASIQATNSETFLNILLKQQINAVFYRGSCDGNLALWFLLTLFFVRISYGVLKKLGIKDSYIILSSFIFAIICNYIGFKYPLYIANSAIGLCMYSCGSTLPKHIQSLKHRAFIFNILLLGTIVLYISIVVFGWCAGDVRSNGGIFPLNIFWLISSLLCSTAINEVFLHYFNKDCYLSRIGEKSMCYLVLHWPIILFLQYFLSCFGIENTTIAIIISAILLLILLPIFSYFFSMKPLRMFLGD